MKIGKDEIMCMKALESIAGVSPKDCIIDENSITFIVSSDAMGAVIGKNGSTIRMVRQKMRKNVEVFEYAPTPEEFAARALRNIKINEINLSTEGNGKTINIKLDGENRRLLMLNAGKLKKIRQVMKRTYGVENLRIR